MRIALLAGGTGAAKLARGLYRVMEPDTLTVITNTGDDDEFWGLLVCPDTDSVLYRLASMFNDDAGFGIRDETFHTLGMLRELHEPVWFGLGDRDIGVHLLRQSLLRQGLRLTEAIAEIARRFELHAGIVPMCDSPVRTRIRTPEGEMSVQRWFVERRCEPRFLGCRFEGVEAAAPSPEALHAVLTADTVIIGPSNPVISIDPILALMSAHLPRHRTVAVSPVVGGRSLKGPTVEMLRSVDGDATAVTVARRYTPLAAHFVLDTVDAALAAEVEAIGMNAHVINTVMDDERGEERFALELLQLIEGSLGS